MAKVRYLLEALLLLAVLKPIVCPSSKLLKSRRYRSANSTASLKVPDATIIEIFQVPDKNGFTPKIEPPHAFQNDEPVIENSSSQEQGFKVQRAPDGKLNLVFNDILFLQNTSEEQESVSNITDDTIHFPGEAKWVYNPQNCAEKRYEKKSFCSKVENYPDLSNLSDQLAKFSDSFTTDLFIPDDITQRMDAPLEETLCKSVKSIQFPQSGLNAESKQVLIVNNDKFKQGVTTVECISEGTACKSIAIFPNNYVATCKQSYSFRRLVVLEKDKTTRHDDIKVPSCCQCVLKAVGN